MNGVHEPFPDRPKGTKPLTIGFGASGAAKDEKALRVDLTHGWRRQGPKDTQTKDSLQGVARRDVKKTSTAWETPRGVRFWKPLCAGVRQRRGRPEGNEG